MPPARLECEGLIRLADRLVGPPTDPDRSGGRHLARYLALACGLALVIVARRPDSILRPQFWAEDGSVFFYEQLTLGFWSALRSPYAGFPFLAQRLIAWLAAMMPTAAVPLAYNTSAIAITALTMATFSLPGFRHLVRSDGLRAALCVATVCMPAGQELLATPTTLGYFLAIWLVLLSVMRAPRTPAGIAAWYVGGVIAVLSAPIAPVVAPLWGLRAIHGIRRHDRGELGFAVTQALVTVASIGMAAWLNTGTRVSGGLPGFEVRSGNLWSALPALGWVVASCVDSAVLPLSIYQRLESLGTLPVLAPSLIVAACVTLAFRDLSSRGRTTVLLGLYLLVASLYLVLSVRHIIVLLLQDAVPNLKVRTFQALGPRHRALANVGLLLIAAGVIDGTERARTRVVAAALTCAALLFAWTPEFRIPPFPDLQWPLWAERLDRKLASGSHEPLVIPAYPPQFKIAVEPAPPPVPNAQRARDEPQGGD